MSRMAEQQLYTNGGYTSTVSGRAFEIINSTIDEVLAAVRAAGHEDVDRAVESAQCGQKIWATVTTMERSRILHHAVDLLRQRNDELARLEALDTGKPLSETAVVDIVAGVDMLGYYADSVPALKDSQIPLCDSPFAYTRREPLGVVAGISVWSYSIQIALRKSAPVLAAGNAMIFEPSEVTLLTALRLTEIYSGADLPDGVFNVLPGIGTETGRYLTEHPDITKIPFIGGVASGKEAMANFVASSLKKITVELGGRSPLTITNDTDLDLVTDIAIMANFYNSGQVCTNNTQVFILAKRKAESEHKILKRMGRVCPGDLFANDTSFSPLVSFPHRDDVLHYIESGKREGTHLLCGGEALKDDDFGNGARVAPTVFIDYNDEMTIMREEISGPVMSVLSHTDEAEVIRHANATEYGPAAGVVMPNLNHAHHLIRQLETGIYWVNSWGESPAKMLVSGYKHSDIDRENGVITLQSYTQVKSTQVRIDEFQSVF